MKRERSNETAWMSQHNSSSVIGLEFSSRTMEFRQKGNWQKTGGNHFNLPSILAIVYCEFQLDDPNWYSFNTIIYSCKGRSHAPAEQ